MTDLKLPSISRFYESIISASQLVVEIGLRWPSAQDTWKDGLSNE